MKAFITGVSRGLGKALASELARGGHEVWGVSRSGGPGPYGVTRHLRCDISSEEDIKAAFEEMEKEGFLPEAVFLNAAVMRDDFDGGLDMGAVRETMEVNFMGNASWVSLLLPLLTNLERGVFVNVSSVSSIRAVIRKKKMLSYPSSKCAMDMLFEGLRLRLGSTGLRFVTARLGPMGDKKTLPLISTTYGRAAREVLRRVEGGFSGTFSHPTAAGILYRAAALLPDPLVRRALG